MSVEAMAPFLAGPASAVFLAVLVGGAVWQFLNKKVMPLVESAVTRHLDQVDRMVATHSEEHQAIMRRLDDLNCRAGAPRAG